MAPSSVEECSSLSPLSSPEDSFLKAALPLLEKLSLQDSTQSPKEMPSPKDALSPTKALPPIDTTLEDASSPKEVNSGDALAPQEAHSAADSSPPKEVLSLKDSLSPEEAHPPEDATASSPEPSSLSEALLNEAKKYESAFSGDEHLKIWIESHMRLLDPNPSECHILDIGLGTRKPLGALLASTGAHIHGIEYAPWQIEHSTRVVPKFTYSPTSIFDYKPTESDVPGQKFDAIFALDATYNLPRSQINDFFNSLHSLLKRGGLLFMRSMMWDQMKEGYMGEECIHFHNIFWIRKRKFRFMGEETEISLWPVVMWEFLLKKYGFEFWGWGMGSPKKYKPPEEFESDEEVHTVWIMTKEGEVNELRGMWEVEDYKTC